MNLEDNYQLSGSITNDTLLSSLTNTEQKAPKEPKGPVEKREEKLLICSCLRQKLQTSLFQAICRSTSVNWILPKLTETFSLS